MPVPSKGVILHLRRLLWSYGLQWRPQLPSTPNAPSQIRCRSGAAKRKRAAPTVEDESIETVLYRLKQLAAERNAKARPPSSGNQTNNVRDLVKFLKDRSQPRKHAADTPPEVSSTQHQKPAADTIPELASQQRDEPTQKKRYPWVSKAIFRKARWKKFLQDMDDQLNGRSSKRYTRGNFRHELEFLMDDFDLEYRHECVVSLLEHMRLYGYPPELPEHAALARCLIDLGRRQEALEVLEKIPKMDLGHRQLPLEELEKIPKGWDHPWALETCKILLKQYKAADYVTLSRRVTDGIIRGGVFGAFDLDTLWMAVRMGLEAGDVESATDEAVKLFAAGLIPEEEHLMELIDAHKPPEPSILETVQEVERFRSRPKSDAHTPVSNGDPLDSGAKMIPAAIAAPISGSDSTLSGHAHQTASAAGAEDAATPSPMDLHNRTLLSVIMRLFRVFASGRYVIGTLEMIDRNLITLVRLAVKHGGYAQAARICMSIAANNPTASAAFNILMNAYMKKGDAARTAEIYQLMVKRGVMPNMQSFCILLTNYSNTGETTKFQKIVGEVTKRRLKPTIAYLNILMGHEVRMGNQQAVLKIFDDMLQEGIKPDKYTIGNLIRAHASNGDTEGAMRALKVAEEYDVEPDIAFFNQFLHIYASRGDLQASETFFSNICQRGLRPDVFTYNTMLHACIVAGDFERCQYWLDEMHRNGVRLRTWAYNTLMSGYAKLGDVDWVRVLFGELALNEKPDAASYHHVMSAYVHAGRLDKMEQVVEEMKAGGIEPTIVTWNIMISAYANIGHMWKASELYQQMTQERKVRPDIVTYKMLIIAYSMSGELETAKRLMSAMRMRNVKPDATIYAAVGRCMAMRGNKKELDSLLAECNSRGLKFSSEHWGGIIVGYTRGGDKDSAERLAGKLEREGVALGEEVFTEVIRACGSAGDMTSAEDWYKRMRDAGVAPVIETYEAFIRSYCLTGQLDVAERWYRSIFGGGLKVTSHTYIPFISYYAKSGDFSNAEKWINELLRQKAEDPELVLSPAAFAQMIHAHATLENGQGLQACLFWWNRMLEYGVKPDDGVYTTLVQAHSIHGTFDDTMDLFENLLIGSGQVHHCRLNPAICSVVLDACGFRKKALYAYDQLWPRLVRGEPGFKPDENMYNSYIEALMRGSLPGLAFRVMTEEMGKAGIQPSVKTFVTFAGMTSHLRTTMKGVWRDKFVELMKGMSEEIREEVKIIGRFPWWDEFQ
ncbi:hypothetical protein HK104_010965 [Borealophlyctis nickersoniae]|nr:hypothetical protein HK104_010965 [Borealophlyctis nickersoniae]